MMMMMMMTMMTKIMIIIMKITLSLLKIDVNDINNNITALTINVYRNFGKFAILFLTVIYVHMNERGGLGGWK